MTVAPIVLPGLGPGRSALITGGTGAIGRATTSGTGSMSGKKTCSSSPKRSCRL